MSLPGGSLRDRDNICECPLRKLTLPVPAGGPVWKGGPAAINTEVLAMGEKRVFFKAPSQKSKAGAHRPLWAPLSSLTAI